MLHLIPVWLSRLPAGLDAAGPGAGAPFTSIRERLEEDPLLAVVARSNDALLGAEEGGRNTLISRIVAVIKVRGCGTVGNLVGTC
jgi:hypothetical protein